MSLDEKVKAKRLYGWHVIGEDRRLKFAFYENERSPIEPGRDLILPKDQRGFIEPCSKGYHMCVNPSDCLYRCGIDADEPSDSFWFCRVVLSGNLMSRTSYCGKTKHVKCAGYRRRVLYMVDASKLLQEYTRAHGDPNYTDKPWPAAVRRRFDNRLKKLPRHYKINT